MTTTTTLPTGVTQLPAEHMLHGATCRFTHPGRPAPTGLVDSPLAAGLWIVTVTGEHNGKYIVSAEPEQAPVTTIDGAVYGPGDGDQPED